MLSCEILKDLSADDLNQRYAESWVQYDKKWVYVRGFLNHPTNREKRIILYQETEGDNKEPIFDWEKLNTERLPSRYYWRNDGRYAYHLSYMPHRQWKRGYTRGNTRLWNPKGPQNFSGNYGQMFEQQLSKTVINNPHDRDAINDRLTTGDILLSEHFLLSCTADLYYKTAAIGTWQFSHKCLMMYDDIWMDELRELKVDHLLATKEQVADIKEKEKDRYIKAKKDWMILDAPIMPADPANIEAQIQITQRTEYLNRAMARPVVAEGGDDVARREPRPRPVAPELVLIPTRPEQMMMNQQVVQQQRTELARIREHNRQIRNIRAERFWDDNGLLNPEED